MIRQTGAGVFVFCASLLLVSCSGLPTNSGCTTNCGGSGNNANLIVVVKGTGPTPALAIDFPYAVGNFVADPVSGSAVGLTADQFAFFNPDMVRLQSDTLFLFSASLPQQQYKDIKFMGGSGLADDVVLWNPTGTPTGNGGSGYCLLTVCPVDATLVANQTFTPTTGAFPLTPPSAIALNFNPSNAITNGTTKVGVDFSQPGQLTVSTLQPINGVLDLVEDFTGTVTAVTSNTVTVKPQFYGGDTGTLTFTAGSATFFDNFDSTACPAQNFTCIKTNQTISVDAGIGVDGTLTLLEVDLLDGTSVDEVEGVITSIDSVNSMFVMALMDSTIVSGNATLTGSEAYPGTLVQILPSPTASYSVDNKGLPLPSAAINGFSSFTSLFVGQTVRVHANSAAFSSSSLYLQIPSDNVVLRFSRLSSTVSVAGTTSGSFFSLAASALPTYITAAGNVSGNVQVEVFPSLTHYDGVSDPGGLSVGVSTSVRALFLPSQVPALYAAKVRTH